MKLQLPLSLLARDKRRRKGNRKLGGETRFDWQPRHVVAVVSVSLLLGLLGTSLHMLQDPSRFPIRSVELEKQDYRNLDVGEVRGELQQFVGRGFFTVNVDEVRERLQTLPWVDRVSVRRVWPDALQVMVVEQWPLARWGHQALLNRRGEIFVPKAASVPPGLPELDGPEGLQHQVAGMYQGVSRLLQPLDLQVSRLRLDGRRAWSLALGNGVEVELGRSQPFARVERFARVYPGLLAGRSDEFERVDLRYTNGLAVRWKSLSEGGSPQVGG